MNLNFKIKNDMKNLSIMAILFLLAITFSCSEDFFDKTIPGSSTEILFYNEEGLDALLIGAYGLVGGQGAGFNWGASISNWLYGGIASDDTHKGSSFPDQVPMNEIERWEVLPTNMNPLQLWRLTIGAGVMRTNEILKILNLIEDELRPEATTRIRAEARFLRALYNFQAWLVFGNIPILTEDMSPEERRNTSNVNPEGAVLDHIINDLRYAWQNLPESQSEVGRPNRYAAMGLASRAYLQELKYAEAKPLLDNIINSGKYELMDNFHDNFKIEHNNNKESIFEIQNAVNDGSPSSGNGQMGISANVPRGDPGFCCGFNTPTQNLANAFKVNENGLPLHDTFNDEDLKNDTGLNSDQIFIPTEDPVDPRLDWTVGRRGIPYLDWGINRGQAWQGNHLYYGPNVTGLKNIHLQSQNFTLSTTTGWMRGANANNWRYIRLGHILLWRAEVAAYEDDLEIARTYVNMIRERAGNQVVMGRVTAYELTRDFYPWGPGTTHGDYLNPDLEYIDWDQPAANYQIGLYPPFASQEEAMKAVQFENRLEFAMEGLRFFDLRRWDKLPSNLNSMPMTETLNSYAQAEVSRGRIIMQGRTFNPNRDKYQPIPQTELDLQPGVLVQNPDY